MSERNARLCGFEESPVIVGHRGAAGLVPENTLPSFEKAVQLGVQAVELDVHLCEGELVVIHDSTLERTTDGRGQVSETAFSLLRTLNAGNGAGVPTLDEVFDLLPSNIGANIELKGAGTGVAVARWLGPPAQRSVLLSSFDHDALEAFREVRDDYPLAPLFGRWQKDALQIADSFGSGFINLSRKAATPARLSLICEAGLKALIYTVNDLEEARLLIEAGAWGLFTDYPDRINRVELSRS